MVLNSKQKGNRAERELSKLLSFITGVRWYRVPCSGSLFTNRSEVLYRGDVYCNDSLFCDVVIECKHYKTFVRVGDLFNPKSLFNVWLDQLRSESYGTDGFLFFKERGRWYWVRSGTGGTSPSLNITFLGKLNRYSVRRNNFGMLTISLNDCEVV